MSSGRSVLDMYVKRKQRAFFLKAPWKYDFSVQSQIKFFTSQKKKKKKDKFMHTIAFKCTQLRVSRNQYFQYPTHSTWSGDK